MTENCAGISDDSERLPPSLSTAVPLSTCTLIGQIERCKTCIAFRQSPRSSRIIVLTQTPLSQPHSLSTLTMNVIDFLIERNRILKLKNEIEQSFQSFHSHHCNDTARTTALLSLEVAETAAVNAISNTLLQTICSLSPIGWLFGALASFVGWVSLILLRSPLPPFHFRPRRHRQNRQPFQRCCRLCSHRIARLWGGTFIPIIAFISAITLSAFISEQTGIRLAGIGMTHAVTALNHSVR